MIDCCGYASMSFDLTAYARTAAAQTGGKLYYSGSPNEFDLPSPNNCNNGDILVRFDGVYTLFRGEWHCLVNSNGLAPIQSEPYGYAYKHMKQEKTDTAAWLALLEE